MKPIRWTDLPKWKADCDAARKAAGMAPLCYRGMVLRLALSYVALKWRIIR